MNTRNFLTLSYVLMLAALLLLLAGTSIASDIALEEGEWEMSTQMEMSGHSNSMPPMTHRQCISKEMMVPSQDRRNQDCEKMMQDVSGNTVTWSMRCTTNGQASEMSGSSTYEGDTMRGTMQMSSQGMKMTSHVTGKRLGPCK